MSHSSIMQLCYWDMRGKAQTIRYLLEYLSLPYEEKKYPMDKTSEWFEHDKLNFPTAFPNLPYLIDNEKYITETEAILQYLCKKAERRDLLGKTEDDQITVAVTRGVLTDLLFWIKDLAYDKSYEKIRDEVLSTKCEPKLAQFNKFMGKKAFLHGYITYVDFLLYQALDMLCMMKPDILSKYDNLKKFQRKFAEQNFMQDYIKSSRYVKKPYFAPFGCERFLAYGTD